MAEFINIAETVELPHPRAAVWPILAKTDWINRAIGLPPVNYQFRALPEGGSEVTARAKIFGLAMAWREFPFEWTEPKYYQVRRVYTSGPILEAVVGLRLNETSAGCSIEIFARFLPRNFVGAFLASRIMGPKTLSDMRALVRHVSEHLAGQQRAVMPRLPRAAANETALATGSEKLRRENLPAPLIEKLRGFLVEATDMELSHIRAFTMARLWKEDRWEVLKLFLHATRAGWLNLSWEVLCPNCRSARQSRAASLAQLAATAHCDVCNIKFDATFDQSVELKFSVHPAVRLCDQQTFCLVGPGGKPHIASQIFLEPGEHRDWDLPAPNQAFRLRSLQVKEAATLPSGQVEVVCAPEKFKFSPAADGKFSVTNPNAFAVQLALEESRWDDEILTAARVTNWQEFRDLFAAEVISPIEQVTVGSQVVLFTDLRGSTAIYSNIGDAPAYALVRDHFRILHDVVSANHGGVVKTIGDAVMAVFSNLTEGLAAAREMHEQLARVKPEKTGRLQLKSALHAGPCLAVNANDRLDFFGTTVNLAARLVERCQGDDLVITDEVYQRAETQKFLGEAGQTGISGEERFTGFPNAVKVWRIPILARA